MSRYECTECDWTGEMLLDALDHAEIHEVRRTNRG